MLATDVKTGGTYLRRKRPVRILRRLPSGGWRAVYLDTGRKLRVKSGRALSPCSDALARATLLADRLIADPAQLHAHHDPALRQLFGEIF